MACDYDKLYGETRDALGEHTAIFVEFFDRLEHGMSGFWMSAVGKGAVLCSLQEKGIA